ncbi:hypothetical protein RM844_28635 [Streptomyces sp. DSM 44915]|uniref:Uncharacterized protein n=1 Tax=Streptomyces chisholmiae TaxID=3075540 RepID=A0ABU2K0E0_9ACTN|nr:hypothetical protein [Streptomyces sp. DSM 44915]MDT0270244.1 hypothetical protein [Streptomyces sp. DSM 44915]
MDTDTGRSWTAELPAAPAVGDDVLHLKTITDDAGRLADVETGNQVASRCWIVGGNPGGERLHINLTAEA